MISGLTPQDIGLPPKFSHWRPSQSLAIDRGLNSQKRFIAHSMPTGEGKSVMYVAHAILEAKRACILTSSKGLQNQLTGDFSSCGLVDIRGRNNYQCIIPECRNCEEGQHHRCAPIDCPYEEGRNKALSSPLVVTNYTYFMLSYLYGRGLGDFDMLILDEAHAAPDEVCSAMTIEIAYWEATKIGVRLPDDNSELNDWWEWGQEVLLKAERTLVELKEEARSDKEESGKVHPSTAKDISFWSKIEAKAKAIINTQNTGRWITERTKEGRKLEPVWARDHAPKILFRNFPRILLTSATMVLKTIDLLGIPRDECDFFEYPSSFPVRRSPVYLWGAAKIDNKTKPGDYVLWQARTNNIIRRRMDRKGIIHSVSYDRAKYIFNNADIEAAAYMIVPESGRDTAAAIEQFKAMPSPGILISPAITTGYDFPGPECEYNIIPKVPFLDTRNKVIAARQEEDPDYGAYVTGQIIQQAHGRSMRGDWDQSETFITDIHIYWFIKKFRHLFAFWFHRLILYPKTMPEPPAPLKAVLPTPNPQGTAREIYQALGGIRLVKK